MKKQILILALFLIGINLSAQNRWSVYGGLNISKGNDYVGNVVLQNPYFFTMQTEAKYTPGGFVGIAYDFNFKHGWSLQPAVEYDIMNYNITNHTNKYSAEKDLIIPVEYDKLIEFTDHLHTLAIPVLVNFRVRVNDNIGLRLGAGPYMQAAVGGKISTLTGERWKVNDYYAGTRKYQFSAGVKAEIAIETGNHLSYSLGFQRPFCNSVIPKTTTINAGVRYTF